MQTHSDKRGTHAKPAALAKDAPLPTAKSEDMAKTKEQIIAAAEGFNRSILSSTGEDKKTHSENLLVFIGDVIRRSGVWDALDWCLTKQQASEILFALGELARVNQIGGNTATLDTPPTSPVCPVSTHTHKKWDGSVGVSVRAKTEFMCGSVGCFGCETKGFLSDFFAKSVGVVNSLSEKRANLTSFSPAIIFEAIKSSVERTPICLEYSPKANDLSPNKVSVRWEPGMGGGATKLSPTGESAFFAHKCSPLPHPNSAAGVPVGFWKDALAKRCPWLSAEEVLKYISDGAVGVLAAWRGWDVGTVKKLVKENLLHASVYGYGETNDIAISFFLKGFGSQFGGGADIHHIKSRRLINKDTATTVCAPHPESETYAPPLLADFSEGINLQASNVIVFTEGEPDAVSWRCMKPSVGVVCVFNKTSYQAIESLKPKLLAGKTVIYCIDRDIKEDGLWQNPNLETHSTVLTSLIEKTLSGSGGKVAVWVCPTKKGKDPNDFLRANLALPQETEDPFKYCKLISKSSVATPQAFASYMEKFHSLKASDSGIQKGQVPTSAKTPPKSTLSIQMPSHPSKKKGGFSLVELLAASLILSIVLIPVSGIVFMAEKTAYKAIARDSAATRLSVMGSAINTAVPPNWFTTNQGHSFNFQSNDTLAFGLTPFNNFLTKLKGKDYFASESNVTIGAINAGKALVTLTVRWNENPKNNSEKQERTVVFYRYGLQ